MEINSKKISIFWTIWIFQMEKIKTQKSDSVLKIKVERDLHEQKKKKKSIMSIGQQLSIVSQ